MAAGVGFEMTTRPLLSESPPASDPTFFPRTASTASAQAGATMSSSRAVSWFLTKDFHPPLPSLLPLLLPSAAPPPSSPSASPSAVTTTVDTTGPRPSPAATPDDDDDDDDDEPLLAEP
jgi:hypothetical protein